MRRSTFVCLLALAACGAPPQTAFPGGGPGGGSIRGDVLLDPPRSDRPLSQALGANGHHVLYVDFEGDTFQPNYDDSTRNQSSIAGAIGQAVTVPPFNATYYSSSTPRDQVIADAVAKVRGFYADFNIDVVTSRPTSGNYVLCAVGGLPDIVGQPCQGGGCVLGLAPLDCRPASPIQYNVQDDVEVVYAFSDAAMYFGGSYDQKVLSLATTIAQESAHSFGLGHSANMQDVMYPEVTGQTVGFLSGAYADQNNCANGVGTQDAHALLLQILGPHAKDTQNPTVKILAPTTQVVPRTFYAIADASDDTGIDHVAYELSGPGTKQTATASASPFHADFTVDADGAWVLTATAYDYSGNTAMATQAVTVRDGAPAQPAPGSVGAPCASNGDCNSMMCAQSGLRKYCTQSCTPGDTTSCPTGMFCQTTMTGSQCAFRVGGGGSSCAVGTDGRSSDLALALVALLGLALALRRRS